MKAKKTMPVDILNPDGTLECTIEKFPVAAWEGIGDIARRQKKSRDHVFNVLMRRLLTNAESAR